MPTPIAPRKRQDAAALAPLLVNPAPLGTSAPAAPKPPHGGRRAGAGRKAGFGLLGDTLCMRIPRANAAAIMAARDALIQGQALPGAAPTLCLFDHEALAGFSPPFGDAEGQRQRVDLYTLFSPRPESTFLIRVAGWSMREAGIHDGDYLVVDRSIAPCHGHVVVAHVEGQGLLVKRLRIDHTNSFLDSENNRSPPIPLGEGSSATILGVARAKAGMLL